MDEERKKHFYEVIDDIGAAMKGLREYHGLTIEEAAVRVDMTPAKVTAIERGRLTTNLTNLTNQVERLGGRLAIVHEESSENPHCQFIEFE